MSSMSGLSRAGRISDLAIAECAAEIRGACRLPIEQAALETVLDWHRSQFEKLLDRPDGGRRWAEFGQRIRSISRHIGALADFFGDHADVNIVGLEQLTQAVKLTRADCKIRNARTPVASEWCAQVPVDTTVTEQFLLAIAPEPQRLSQAV